MKAIAICVVQGLEYEALSIKTRPLAEKNLGVRTVLHRPPPGEDPFLAKLGALKFGLSLGADVVVLFDTDMVMVRPWPDPVEFSRSGFRAVLDTGKSEQWREVSKYCALERYFNSGVWVARPDHLQLFQEAARIAPRFAGERFAWGEQTALNVACQGLGVPLAPLPPSFNRQTRCDPPRPGDYVLHANTGKKLRDVDRLIAKYG